MWASPLEFLGLSLLMEHLLSTPWNQRTLELGAWKSFIQPHIFLIETSNLGNNSCFISSATLLFSEMFLPPPPPLTQTAFSGEAIHV